MKLNILPENIHLKDLINALLFASVAGVLVYAALYISIMILVAGAFFLLVFMIIAAVKYLERSNQKYISKKNSLLYSQIQSFSFLHQRLNPEKALPILTGSAISPDLGNILVDKIIETRAELIVECGSGVSTLISAYTLKKQKNGLVISLDHEEKYANITSKNIMTHQLNSYAKVVYTPIKSHEIDNQMHLFYDLNTLKEIKSIDILFVDGPPRTINSNIRYAALPLFIEKIKKGGIVIIDDAKRKAEQEIVKRWLLEFPIMKYEYIPTEKGTVILTKTT